MQTDWLPRINTEACTGCRECIARCPTGALVQVNGKAALVYPERCTYCAACESICPAQAIDLPYLICKKDSK
jgi:ferredoxin